MKVIKASNPQDRQLLEGLVKADSQVIERVYDLALPAVINWIKTNQGTEADAKDIFQEALLALYGKLQKEELVLTCTLKSFLRIMCRNLWLTRLRNKNRSAVSPLEDIELVELDEEIIRRIEASEREQLYFKHFDALGENCRKILQWFFDKVSLKTIAAKLDTSENYIKKRKFICKEKLTKAIQADPLYKELTKK